MKRIATLLLTLAVIALSGCNGSENAQTTPPPAVMAEAWEYEYYVEDLDYYMEQYNAAVAQFSELCALQDYDAAADEAESHIEILDKIAEIITPAGLEEYQNDILTAVEYEKEYRRLAADALYYLENYNTLTSAEQEEYDLLRGQIEEIETEYVSINDAVYAAREAAFSCLPNGEYRSYDSNLVLLWNRYVAEYDRLYDVFFNGVEGDALVICENCLEALSAIENMTVPEQVKSYHDDIIEAISEEREYCLAVKNIKELNNKYQGLALEDTPADVQEQIEKCSEIIDNYFNEDSAEYDTLYDAVIAAHEFATAQAGQ